MRRRRRRRRSSSSSSSSSSGGSRVIQRDEKGFIDNKQGLKEGRAGEEKERGACDAGFSLGIHHSNSGGSSASVSDGGGLFTLL
jgi:hypothetical protein